MEIHVNGVAHEINDGDIRPEETALDIIRNKLLLTGAKRACDAGACGACTIWLNQKPVIGCLLPAHAMAGQEVHTIEGIGPKLHPVQKAFLANDALQCGFCTPGVILEAIYFYQQWRAKATDVQPTREEIQAALCGHLCRCGAYEGMIRALQEACAGRFEGASPPYGPRQDAYAKVTGQTRYTVDVQYDGQLEGVILRSPYAHAKVKRIDISQAATFPGVRAVVILLNRQKKIRYIGQEVLAVAAENMLQARKALDLIQIEYQVLSSTVEVSEAQKPSAPRVYPQGSLGAPNVGENPLFPARWQGNIRGPLTLMSQQKQTARRIVQQACADGETRVQGTWRTQAVCHAPLEPHACVALWPDERRVKVHISTQSCARIAQEIGKRWHLPLSQVEVICNAVGGAFGAKLGLTSEAVAAIELSRRAQRPVRVVFERQEEFISGGYRPAVTLHLKASADGQGDMKALSVETYGDTGIGIGSYVANLGRAIYPGIPKYLADYDIVTHNPPGKPFRAPGGPPLFWALEQAVDELAQRVGCDPVQLRRRWQPVPQLSALYDWVESLPAWQQRHTLDRQSGSIRRGIGLAVGNWLYFVQPNTQVSLQVTAEGVVASTASQDIGNGTATTIAQEVARVLDCDPQDIHVELGNSHYVMGPAASGSRTTASVVPASQHAAEQLRATLEEIMVQREATRTFAIGPLGIRSERGLLTWQELAASYPKLSVTGKRQRDAKRYTMPFAIKGTQIGHGSTWSACVCEVEVNMLYGTIRVQRVWSAIAAGRIIVPALARSQVHGGIIQGIGYALFEERQQDRQTGRVMTTSFDAYHLPGIAETPVMDIFFYEGGFEYVRGGAVGLAEISTVAVAASIGNAVAHATGWRPRELPLRPDRVLNALYAEETL
ncbi:molybdopterin-dependent oxidoreductase [Ktedonobacter robiniae]|uniref:Xanthine dehydrogenase n=1 Tax=Ktedonobacter robiniae TaxID=2778365 RepID=A0ABQ3V527_9CHLR|nr:molybdopterin-dependent oxidoreductase [Ktedonobacter robiniae]GHO59994.1 xanthine dehydrogenase [Ktedonobacter robiniae]